MLENLRHDYRASTKREPALLRMLFRALQDSGFRAMCFYRIGRWCRKWHIPLGAPLAERLMRHLSHCWISTLAVIGPGFRIAHVCGIIVPPKVVFGSYCEIRQNVTLGGNMGKRTPDGRTVPTLGDRVSIGPGAVILGPIQVGADTFVGANAVLTRSVPERSIVAAFRAEIVAERDEQGQIVRAEENMFLSRRELYTRIESLRKRVEELEAESRAARST
jgi:serine O-acetyltransferase